MLRPPTRRLLPAVVACCLTPLGIPARAVDPPAAAAKKIDWARIDGLIAAGDYAAAATAADEFVQGVKPRERDPDFLVRSIDRIRLLMRRGLAELRLGRLDDADATFVEASRIFKDADFKRFLAIETRRATPRTETALVLIDINFLELLDLRMAVILTRLQLLNLGIDVSDGLPEEDVKADGDRVGRWLAELDALERSADRARDELTERLKKGGPSVLASPHYQAIVGRYRPALVAALKATELSRLPPTGTSPAVDDSTPARSGGGGVAEARRLLQEAAAALDAAIAAAAPKGVAGMKPEARIEAALMRADLLTCEGTAELRAGDPRAGRERFAKVLDLQREVATLRRLPRPEAHPDLFVPLLLSAEAILDESLLQLKAGDSSTARAGVLEASRLLARADELAVPPEHPLRAWLASLQARGTKDLSAVKAAIPGMDAADAAARRIRQAIDGTAASSAAASP